MKGAARSLIIAFALYLCYLAATVWARDFIFPPAQQAVIFQYDVLDGKFPVSSPPKILILGDSTAAFGYSAGTVPGALALTDISGSFAEVYFTLKRYLEKFPAPNCIVLTASYAWAYHRNHGFWDIYAANGYYSLGELGEIYDTSRAVGDFPARDYSKPGYLFKALLYRLRLQGVHMADIQDAIFEQQLYKSNQRFHLLMRKNAGNINKSNMRFPFMWEPHEHLNETFEPSPLYDEYLKRLIRLAADNKIVVHWVQTPVSARAMNEAAHRFFADLNSHLEPIIRSSPRNTYTSTTPNFPDDHFFSATHLNIAGAHAFTNANRELFQSCDQRAE